jgi:hypothetical protein
MSASADEQILGKRRRNTHIFAPAEGLHYVEPQWVSVRLFETERFPGPIWDPFVGWGRVAEAARAAGYQTRATDKFDRGYKHLDGIQDFLDIDRIDPGVALVSNPPFVDEILTHAIGLNPVKMALIWPLARIVAAWPRLVNAPLARILMLTPRPSIPPGSYLAAGRKPQDARPEFAWMIFERGHRGAPELGWLHRDRGLISTLPPPSAPTSPPSAPATPLPNAPVAPPPSALPGSTGAPPTNTSAPAEPVHSRFGGSVAVRVLRCPASVSFVEKVPAYLRKASSYAARGVALHAAMVRLLDDDAPPLEDLVGQTFNDYVITADDVENALRPTFVYVDELLSRPGAEFYLERRVAFPTVAGAYGTTDLLVRTENAVYVLDFKFGAGVRVLALTPDGDTDIINPQLLFYAAGARHSLPQFFAGIENVTLTIVQPTVAEQLDAEMVSSVTVTAAELDEFIAIYRNACAEALSDTPHLERGTWCRFCPAKPICPLHTGPLFDLAQFAALMPAAFAAPPAKEAYLRLLASGLDLLDAVKDLRTALHDQAKRALESGDIVPGYTLSGGRAERHWRDEAEVYDALSRLGLIHNDMIEETLRSPRQMELSTTLADLLTPPLVANPFSTMRASLRR